MAKLFLWMIAGALFAYGTAWLFNHVHPYIAIGIVFLALFLILKQIDKQIKKQQDEEN